MAALIVGIIAGCASAPSPNPTASTGMEPGPSADEPLPPPIQRGKSRWTPVRWADLPGWGQDNLHEAWNAWVRS